MAQRRVKRPPPRSPRPQHSFKVAESREWEGFLAVLDCWSRNEAPACLHCMWEMTPEYQVLEVSRRAAGPQHPTLLRLTPFRRYDACSSQDFRKRVQLASCGAPAPDAQSCHGAAV